MVTAGHGRCAGLVTVQGAIPLLRRHRHWENAVALTAPAPVATDLTDEVRRIVRLILAELEQACPACTLSPGPHLLECARCAGRTLVLTPLGAHALATLGGSPGGRGGKLVGRAGTALTPKATRVLIEAARAEWEIFAARHAN
jgi:hypothetical protein